MSVPSNIIYEIHIFHDQSSKTVTIYAFDEEGQGHLVGARDISPFDTALETSQWIWTQLTLDQVHING